MIGGPNSLVFVTALLAALATPMLGWAKGKPVNHSTASRKTAPPVVMSLPPIPIPRPNRAPLESAGETASTAQGRPNDRPAARAGKNRSIIIRPSDDEGQRVPPRAVLREVARRVSVAGGVIVLPVVAFFGAPVILDVPGIGYVDVPEDEYARLYDKLSSPDPDQIETALATLRKIKAVEDEAVEAAQRRPPDDLLPPPERDLSEPISFGSRFSIGVPRRGRRFPGLY
jgi:hypothetical protein